MIDILLQKRGVSHALAHVSVLQIDFFVGNSGVWITHYSIMLEINGWNTDLNHSSRPNDNIHHFFVISLV